MYRMILETVESARFLNELGVLITVSRYANGLIVEALFPDLDDLLAAEALLEEAGL